MLAAIGEMDFQKAKPIDIESTKATQCDVMKCKIEEKEITFYFDVTISMTATSKLFETSNE